MFGQNNNQKDDAQIPEHTIDAALQDQEVSSAPITPPSSNTWQHPGKPLDDTGSVSPTSSTNNDTGSFGAPVQTPSDEIPSDLIDIKQQALSQLAPLVGQLDQSPEERFRTTMMMIQASDDQSLVKDAYAAAQAITDEKARAQALLDIVNEINYFTQQHQS